jgi:hypothetical protein
MEKINLNEVEKKVYDACIKNANNYGEEGGFCYEEIDLQELGITINQLKGYLSQLVQKKLIWALDDSYFSHQVRNMIPEC